MPFQLKISRVPQGDRTHANRMRKINAAVPDKLQNQVFQYIATVNIGTPAQPCQAALDTGSSDLWVFTKSSGLSGSFDPSKSSTYQFLNNDFSIQYVSGSTSGDWVKDNVSYGQDDAVKSLQFATVGQQTMQGETAGIFGIGQESQETTAEFGSTYTNFPAALTQQGITKVNAYSLYLDSISAKNGSSITFGGLDKSKYTGTLWTIPFTSQVSFNVDFQVAGFSGNGVLDSGTSLTYLPQEAADQVAQTYGATWNNDEHSYILQGSPASSDPLVYTFAGGAQISVPVSELFVQESGVQVLTVLPSSQSQNVTLLGDSFLRSAYVVYHLQANIAGIAQANWSPGSPDLVEITGDSIPGAQPLSSS